MFTDLGDADGVIHMHFFKFWTKINSTALHCNSQNLK